MRKKLSMLVACLLASTLTLSVNVYALADTGELSESDLHMLDSTIENENDSTLTVDGTEYNVSYSYVTILQSYYLNLISKCDKLGVLVDSSASFEAFCDAYYAQDVYLISQYSEYLDTIIEEKAANLQAQKVLTNEDLSVVGGAVLYSSSDDGWWYDIGENLPQAPNYNNAVGYAITRGDILYEQGSPYHTAIVECSIEDDQYGFYWRVIESLKDTRGVVRSVVDDDRLVKFKGVFLTVPTAIPAQRVDAIQFCINQLGDGYILNPIKVTDADLWMCSVLVWAAYNSVGIDLVPDSNSAYPTEIFISPYVNEVESTIYKYLEFTVKKSYYTFPAFWSWDIEIYNPNLSPVTVKYNSKLCNVDDAKRFDEEKLTNLVSITIPGRTSVPVHIQHNGTAGAAAASIYYTHVGITYKIVTYAYNLAYSNNVGSCTEKNVTLLYTD